MGSHTSQSGRGHEAARIAAEVAARQAAETARLEALRQLLQTPVAMPKPTLTSEAAPGPSRN
ncbi:hypothetical protein ACLESD_10605 [Pyxidicoccus sp. 3LFB2]